MRIGLEPELIRVIRRGYTRRQFGSDAVGGLIDQVGEDNTCGTVEEALERAPLLIAPPAHAPAVSPLGSRSLPLLGRCRPKKMLGENHRRMEKTLSPSAVTPHSSKEAVAGTIFTWGWDERSSLQVHHPRCVGKLARLQSADVDAAGEAPRVELY